ncbi:MAG TPA: DUF192 domain-containing protein [Xanthobacteraceae bacterium]|nr:DUF192 domain-containing protein [Xanthobacteraceae bacterium]
MFMIAAPSRLFARFALVLLVIALGFSGRAEAQALDPLTIATKAGPVAFQVEFAASADERAKGLMYRTELAPDRGMLFDFRIDAPVYMWMKNTYIPLDMVFIRADGHIVRIAQNTTPLSTETIASGGPVRAVLELPAGTAKARGLAVGDRVAHRMFPKD